ncbi:MAG TPA: glucose-6-phosphate dehydrogenase [Actinomycetota bacterium]|nr:glucose-6-phosphate dehydrogenase [Actinomycetota bacterium]
MTVRTQTPEKCIVVIFGASGDLTSRKLMPALHNLQHEGLIPDETSIVGSARTSFSDDEFRASAQDAVKEHSRIAPTDDSWSKFARDIYYVPGDVTDDALWTDLKSRLTAIDDERGTAGNRVWYLATLPRFFSTISERIGKSGLLDTGGWHRLVVEKPFGTDLASARELNATLATTFSEDQIFRIDHYLGKETVQNLLVFRFANAIFEPIWNRRYIDHVQITVGEDIGIEDRAAFYEQTGALRDVGQNHLMQMLALIGMEPPVSWDAEAIRNEKVQVLKAVHRFRPDECAQCVVRGQYDGYRTAEDVDARSATETFVAMRLTIDNWRWAGVPFYVRTGKRLAAKATEVAIHFQQVPHLLFEKTAVQELDPNVLTIRVQPDEGISLSFGTKVPGPEVNVTTVDMDFDYETDFGSGSPEAYERLLLDCMNGDATLFTRADEIEEAWGIVDPVLEYWRRGGTPGRYPQGSWGPASSDELIARDGREWREPRAR